MTLNTDHYARGIGTPERLNAAERESIDFEIFRNAVVKEEGGRVRAQQLTKMSCWAAMSSGS